MSDQISPKPDIPEDAVRRLREMRGGDGKKGLFTSDLSISEFLLVKEAGFDPVGLVIGSSIYHIGLQIANYRQNQELQVLSQAMYQARELAMSRMEEEADALGADGIVGVRLDINRYEWGQGLCAARRGACGPTRTSPSPRTSPARISGLCCRPATRPWRW
jgi:uncharacterized protein YbjQ (UPF0145 family)